MRVVTETRCERSECPSTPLDGDVGGDVAVVIGGEQFQEDRLFFRGQGFETTGRFLRTPRAGLRTNRRTARTSHGPSTPDEITILGLSPRTTRGRFTGFFLGDAIDEFPRFHIEPCSDVQER